MTNATYIAVDVKVLAKVLGLEEWHEDIINDQQAMALRCVTDFVRPDAARPSADISMGNATAWINRAYDAGKSAGIVQERRAWREKLAKLFDIPIR